MPPVSSAPAAHSATRMRTAIVLAGVLLLAANLRAGITSVGPVLSDIRADLGFGSATASFLVALPVIGFAVISPFAPAVARRVGLEWALGGSLVVLAAAIVLRSVPAPGAIWVGTAVLGAAIAMLNVLIPALIKREYPRRVGQLTGVYSALQSGVAAIAAGLAVPIAGASGSGWRLSLGIWAALALIGFGVFLPQLRRRPLAARPPSRAGAASGPALWTSPLAWQVTVYLGLQSTVYYTVITWWPAIERSTGLSAAGAGWHQFIFQCCGIVGSLSAAAMLHRLHSQSALAAISGVFAVIGCAGQLLVPQASLVWVLFLGVSGGASIAIALSLFGLRTRNHLDAAALSSMAQSVGYLLAAFGPILVGVLRDVTGSWTLPIVVLLAVSAGVILFGSLAGRARFVGAVGG